MDTFEAINKRRSVRAYEDAPLPREDLERIVAAAVEAPSGCNMNLCQYVIIDDQTVIETACKSTAIPIICTGW